MTEHHDDFDRALGERLAAYERRAPGATAPDLNAIGAGTSQTPGSGWRWAGLVAVGGVAAGIVLVVVLSGRFAPPTGHASPTPMPSAASSIPSVEPSVPAPTAIPSASPGDALRAGGFAQVTAAVLEVRTEPGLAAPFVTEFAGDGPPVNATIGTDSHREHVFIVDGPTQADGSTWYQVAPRNSAVEQSISPPFVGWVTSGGASGSWMVAEDPCPAPPIDLATLTVPFVDWSIGLGCLQHQEITLRGWLPDLPSGVAWDGTCPTEPGWLVCGSFDKDIRPFQMDYYDPRSANRLSFSIDPAGGVVLPPRGQWIEVTGAFDHPASQQCGPDPTAVLSCRVLFVVDSVRALGSSG
jgi:hypothetical protein